MKKLECLRIKLKFKNKDDMVNAILHIGNTYPFKHQKIFIGSENYNSCYIYVIVLDEKTIDWLKNNFLEEYHGKIMSD